MLTLIPWSSRATNRSSLVRAYFLSLPDTWNRNQESGARRQDAGEYESREQGHLLATVLASAPHLTMLKSFISDVGEKLLSHQGNQTSHLGNVKLFGLDIRY